MTNSERGRMTLLSIRDLRVVFHTEEGLLHAVNGVSFELEKGRTLGLVGESGCGKSVTSLSIMRLIPAPPGEIVGGEIFWKGRDILKIPLKELPNIRGREIAMVFQEPMTSLNPVFTVGSQLGEVLKIRFGLRGDASRRRIVEMLGIVGIADPVSRLNSYPHELSGGMMQRVMIAMALLCEPDLLIADEPTTALDVTIQAQILRLIRDLREKTGMAVLFITHDMGVVAETCDDVAVMYAGRIAECAGVAELFAHPGHPYTSGLLHSIPRHGTPRNVSLFTIEGNVPSLLKPPAGCLFAERCFRRKERLETEQKRCRSEAPVMRAVSPNDHLVACHYPLELVS